QLGGVEVHVAAGEVGIAGIHQLGDDLDILVDAAGGGLDHIRRLDIQPAAVLKEGIGVELGDLHDRLVLPLGALEHLVLALIGIGGQVAHVGDIHHPVDIIASPAEELLQHVLHDITAQVADVGEVIHCGAAGVHLHAAGGVGLELLFLVGGRIVQVHKHCSFYVSEPADSSRRLLRYCSSMSFSKNSRRDKAAFNFSSTGSRTLIWSTSSAKVAIFPATRTTWAGTPTAVQSSGTALRTTAPAAMRALSPTVKGPSTLAPEPTITLLPRVGWRLPLSL
ncbi:16S rRNA (cytidine(1402)-2'-O)-methyltransferase, partial [Dysosmobacter welbionis]